MKIASAPSAVTGRRGEYVVSGHFTPSQESGRFGPVTGKPTPRRRHLRRVDRVGGAALSRSSANGPPTGEGLAREPPAI
jgi:hypothetical protein